MVISKADVNGGTVDGTAIGASAPSTGRFTTLEATGELTVSGNSIDNDTDGDVVLQRNNVTKLTLTASGVTVGGTLSGNGSGLTSLPAANLTGTLPALDGSALTGVAATSIADGAVTSAKILDATVVSGDLADNAVTSAKILDATVATGDLADGSVTSAKIVDGAITAGDVGSSQVVKSLNTLKDDVTLAAGSGVTITSSGSTLTISSGATTGTIADNAITSAKIADGEIVDADINASAAISPSKIGTGALDLGANGLTASGVTYGNALAITTTANNGDISLTPNGTGSVVISKADVNGGAIDGTTVGASTPSTGAFTTLSASGATTLSSTLAVTGDVSVNISKFQVAAASGNTSVGGTLTSAGLMTGSAGLTVTGGVASVTGGDAVTLTLNTSTARTANGKLVDVQNNSMSKFSVDAEGDAAVAGDLTVTGTVTAGSVAGVGNTLDAAYDQGGDGAGRTITADNGAVAIGGTGGLLVTGTFGSGAIPAEDSGTRMMFYPKKAAFRAGFVAGDLWNDANVGDYSTVTGGYNNKATAMRATVGGGISNTASASQASVVGGASNTASGQSAHIGGGESNTASGSTATIGGGVLNTASNSLATVGGGSNNTTTEFAATVGGGHTNSASGGYATVPGGKDNTASGMYSFAAGRQAKANHNGAFVWADDTASDFASTAEDQFLIRAAGGVGIGTASPGAQLTVNQAAAADIVDVQDGGTDVMKIYDGGIVDMPKQSACRAYLGSDQSIDTGAWLKVPYDTESYDIQSEFVSGTFTATKAGIYSVKAQVWFTTGAANTGEYIVTIKLSGALYSQLNHTHPSDNDYAMVLLTDDVKMTAGQYIEIWAYQSSTATQTIKATQSRVAIHKLQ